MNLHETTVILYMLSAYYGMGKADARSMAMAWHAILKEYDFGYAQEAVIEFAKRDERDYAAFPAVGKIIKSIDERVGLRNLAINGAYNGDEYDKLPDKCKEVVTKSQYEKLTAKTPEELLENRNKALEWLMPTGDTRMLTE